MVSVEINRGNRMTERASGQARAGTATKVSPKLKKVFICSPFHPMGATEEERDTDLERNLKVARLAARYAIEQGHVPYAPHLYFPQMLSEDSQTEREMGIVLGLTWLARCDELWIIGDRISEGMKKEIEKAKEWHIPIREFDIHIPSKKRTKHVVKDKSCMDLFDELIYELFWNM